MRQGLGKTHSGGAPAELRSRRLLHPTHPVVIELFIHDICSTEVRFVRRIGTTWDAQNYDTDTIPRRLDSGSALARKPARDARCEQHSPPSLLKSSSMTC